MTPPDLRPMLDLAQQLATEATELAMPHIGQPPSGRKADRSVVTETDHAIQAHILTAIARRFPEHAVLAEETVSLPGAHAPVKASRFCWVIDPLDGTRNFVAGFPCFATSIAILDRGMPIVAVVVEHNLRHTYAATRKGGATRNGCPIHVQTPPPGEDMLIGCPSSKDALTVQVLRNWLEVPGFVLRNTGSAATHLALVASGTLAGAFARRCKIWDIAAGMLLVTEAGGTFTNPTGQLLRPLSLDGDPNEDIPFLACATGVHDRLLATIRSSP